MQEEELHEEKEEEEESKSRIMRRPVDSKKNRRGGAFVCEVNKKFRSKKEKVDIFGRLYLPNRPLTPGGPLEFDVEFDLRGPNEVFQRRGKSLHVYIVVAEAEKKKKQKVIEVGVMPLESLTDLKDRTLVFDLPRDIPLTEDGFKLNMCVDIHAEPPSKKKLHFIVPIEEMNDTQSVIVMARRRQRITRHLIPETGEVAEPPAKSKPKKFRILDSKKFG